MKKNILYRKELLSISMALLILVLPSYLFSQNTKVKYSISVSTDRSLYVVGETVEIKITIPEFTKSNKLTRSYIYCDLLGQGGQRQTSIKLVLLKGKGKGQINIPSSAKSGYYIIRAYTREMRLDPTSFGFACIKVVNIENRDLLGNNENSLLKLDIDSINNNNKYITINNINKSINKRTKVGVELDIDTSSVDLSSLSISIVPKLTFNNTQLKVKLLSKDRIIDKLAYPETKGFSLSGTIVQKDTNLFFKRKRIFISIVGTKDVFTTISDTTGKFYVSLPLIYGEHEVYISTDTIDKNSIILIDKDYDLKTNYWLNKEFRLTNSEKKLAFKLAQNLAISRIFNNMPKADVSIIAKKPFYFNADETIVIMDYIDLPSLHMYFTELPSSVHLYNPKKYKARIWDSNEIPLLENPLIMVDYVAVNDLSRVLKLNPKLINRIEVINTYYQKGDLSFGGIINFISNNNDFGGLEFKNSSLVFNYSFLTPYIPIKPIDNVNIPDARTTLYWNPNIKIAGRKSQFYFHSSDVEGDFEVVVQGIDKKGEKFVSRKSFSVK